MSILACLFSSLISGSFCFSFHSHFSGGFGFNFGFFSGFSSNFCFDGGFFSDVSGFFCNFGSGLSGDFCFDGYFCFNRRLTCKGNTGDESCGSSTCEKFLHKSFPS